MAVTTVTIGEMLTETCGPALNELPCDQDFRILVIFLNPLFKTTSNKVCQLTS